MLRFFLGFYYSQITVVFVKQVIHKAASPTHSSGHFSAVGEVMLPNDIARLPVRCSQGRVDIVCSGICFRCHQAAPCFLGLGATSRRSPTLQPKRLQICSMASKSTFFAVSL